ncbi:SusC/RagA family TonB-linked outer membrane protein [Pedobacter steynii]|nr:SusC/RagA family TonB-linked outer membrane protein [Pedobacter steynii]NQX38476.1 SusC/RagA family TonB-linked outer membrane protein [Pedobacter steynii]
MKLTTILMLFSLLQVGAKGFGQITLNQKNVSLEKALRNIEKQTDYVFFYPGDLSDIEVNIKLHDVPLEAALDACLRNLPFSYKVVKKTVVISALESRTMVAPYQLSGKVTDSLGMPLPGAVVRVKGKETRTTSDSQGRYYLTVEGTDVLVFSYIGFKTQEIKIHDRRVINISLLETKTSLGEIVVTGMMDRKKDSFTGAAVTISGDQLKAIGNQNIIQSLKTLDPSIIVLDNNRMGSNPNTLPTIELRGKSGLSQTELKDQFGGDPNQPLFILDGFETDLRTIVDLDMNRVASATILKDAASTALYGARAANGVVVIKTKVPLPGTMRISYTGDYRVEMLDLSDYNLMNAAEKLEFERLSGRFTFNGNNSYLTQATLDTLYYARLANVRRGVNTDWLRVPGQTGFTNGHSVYADGGDEQVRYSVGLNFRNATGLMKGSGRQTWGANVDLVYRKNKVSIANKLYVNGYRADESPYGSFSDFSRANPYNTPYDKDGKVLMYLETLPRTSIIAGFGNIGSPLYNATLDNQNRTTNLNIQNNLQAVFTFNNSFKLDGGLQLNRGGLKNITYTPPEHTMFQNSTIYERGSYKQTRADNLSYNANLMFTFAKAFTEKQLFNANLRADIEQKEDESIGLVATGFPLGTAGDPSFAFSYQPNSKPQRASRIYRRNNVLASINYTYDQRFVIDATYRLDGSTAFGSQKQYSPFWSAGAAWNVHNESFLQNSSVGLLRLRGNVGTTGNQGFASISSISTYGYATNTNILGQGVSVLSFGNENLEWQKTLQTSVGIDLSMFNNRLSATLNAYDKYSNPLVVFINPPSSTGISGYATNAGNLTTKGLEANVRFSPYFRPNGLTWSIGLLASMVRSKYGNFNNILNSVNSQQLANNSLIRYTDGHSPDDIWAVESAGIDPGTGRELFINAQGEYTFTYNVNDIKVVGNSRPDIEGVISSNLSYKGFQFGVNLRYSFGGDLFNEALYNKVENIDINSLYLNQDKRALYSRWQDVGDRAQFKGISLTDRTPISSRFVQRNNFIVGESFNVGYWINDTRLMKKLGIKSVRFNVYMNDIFRVASVKAERGIDYPFANTISSSLNVSF